MPIERKRDSQSPLKKRAPPRTLSGVWSHPLTISTNLMAVVDKPMFADGAWRPRVPGPGSRVPVTKQVRAEFVREFTHPSRRRTRVSPKATTRPGGRVTMLDQATQSLPPKSSPRVAHPGEGPARPSTHARPPGARHRLRQVMRSRRRRRRLARRPARPQALQLPHTRVGR